MKSLLILIVSTFFLSCLSALTVTKRIIEILPGAIFSANFAYPDHDADFKIEIYHSSSMKPDSLLYRFSWEKGLNTIYIPGPGNEEHALSTGFLNHVDNEIYFTVRAFVKQTDIFINDLFVGIVQMQMDDKKASYVLHIVISHPGEYFGDVFVPGHPFLDFGDKKTRY